MSGDFSENAKKLRKQLYDYFLTQGRSENAAFMARDTGLTEQQVRDALEELDRGVMVMLQPGTHDVVKVPPWTNTPTRHRIEKGSSYVTYVGCGIEAINISFCYPGEEVTLRSTCRHTGCDINLRFKDGKVLEHTPASPVLRIGTNPDTWYGDYYHACDHNCFFASAVEAAEWEALHPETPGATITMAQFNEMATYTYERRFTYDRGSDLEAHLALNPRLRKMGVKLPESWAARQPA